MRVSLRVTDTFTKNIIIVFAGTSLVNLFNLLYQLLIAHKLSASEFAAFNSLLSIFMVISAPLGTIHIAVAKYGAQFNSNKETEKIKFLISGLLKKATLFSVPTFLFFCLLSTRIVSSLKISSVSSGYILAALLALAWLNPVLLGGIQGIESFRWLASAQVFAGISKLLLAFVFILLGYNIAGALGALLASNLIASIIFYLVLRRFIILRPKREEIDYKQILAFLFPVAISYFCFIALVSSDMVLVKFFLSQTDSGIYSLAQMIGKIFLFLPVAISVVMFPRTSGLNAKNMDTVSTLKKSLLYVSFLCACAIIFYNLFPSFVLKVLTGKVFPESILLGRLFSISMSFFALLYILIAYFLSVKDLRFIKYLFLLTFLQISSIIFFHRSVIWIQGILCINSVLLFSVLLFLAFKRKG